MISDWRTFPPAPQQERPPEKESHIWDEVSVEQNASMSKANQDLATTVLSMIDHLPAEQQSMYDKYIKENQAVAQEVHAKTWDGINQTVRKSMDFGGR